MPDPLQEYDYFLPPGRIAHKPRRRGCSRLLVMDVHGGRFFHRRIRDLPLWLRPGDCLVLNDSRVIPARLWAVKMPTGAGIEVLLHRQLRAGCWEALVSPSRRLRPGARLRIGPKTAEVVSLGRWGRAVLQFSPAGDWSRFLAQNGEPPLPPYIKRFHPNRGSRDRKRYQTVFARLPGSVAAPTAGLHFTRAQLRGWARRGIKIVRVTLHVGWGTFSPLTPEAMTKNALHPERYRISRSAANAVNRCRLLGGRIIACGTTAARALESSAAPDGTIRPGAGETSLFIRPPYAWKVVDGLLTNFHLPRSSLLLLASALAGREQLLAAYALAVQKKYRFFSYGDAMLLI